MNSTTVMYIIFKSYCGNIEKNQITNLFSYFLIYFSIGTHVEVTFSHFRFKPKQNYFHVVLYFSMISIFCLLQQFSISYASLLKYLNIYLSIYFTMEIDVEVTLSHLQSILRQKYFNAILYYAISITIWLYI